MLKIAVISKSDSSGGGASRVAESLATLLNQVDGCQAHHWVGRPGIQWRPHMRALSGHGWKSMVGQITRHASARIGLPDFLTPEVVNLRAMKSNEYNVYHFHDTSQTFSPIAMRRLAKRHPVVWTLHDCSPFTAGCLYPRGCTAFHSCCGSCPQLGTWPLTTRIDLTGTMHRYKRRTAESVVLTPIAPSRWMAQQAEQSRFWQQPVQIIPYGVDSSLFRPQDRKQVRNLLGLPPEAFLVLLSAGNLHDERKGTRLALEAIAAVERPVHVLAVGATDGSIQSLPDHIAITATGYIANNRALALYYAAADLYLFPSLADNLPNSILECMACGTPTLAFANGGIPEMIEHRVSGWLVPSDDTAALTAGLAHAFDHPDERRGWGQTARARAEELFSVEQFLDRHLALYRRLSTTVAGLPVASTRSPSTLRKAG